MPLTIKVRRLLCHLILFSFCISALSSCGSEVNNPLRPEPPIELKPTTLTLSTTHATGESMELYWVVFDANGAVVKDDSNKSIRRALAVNLKGKTHDITAGRLTEGSMVTVLGFVSQTEGDMPVMNENISKITEPIVTAGQGSTGLFGDFFYGKYIVKSTPSATGEVKLERLSGQMTLRLTGDAALVNSVLRVEFDFSGVPFHNGISGSGELLKVVQGSTQVSSINFAQQSSSYLLPSVVATGDSGKGRIYYGQGQVKEFSWGADASLRIESNQQTTITLKLSGPDVDPEPPIDPGLPDPEQVIISLTGSLGLVNGGSDQIDNGTNTKGYYTYKLIKRISKAEFSPSTMALDGELLYVGNTKSKLVGSASPWNQPTYSVEVFNILTGQHVKTLPRDWTIIADKQEQFIGSPRAITLSKGLLYAAYSSGYYTRVVVYDLASGMVETCIGTGVAAALQGKDAPENIDEPMSIYADNGNVYLIDNYRKMRIYKEDDITKANYNKIKPYAKSAIDFAGKPHIISMFRSPGGTLYCTDYKSQKLLAIDPLKIKQGDGLDIMNPALDVDISDAMFDDPSIRGLFTTIIPYGVAYHHGNMFAVVSSEDDSGKRAGYLSEYSADGKRFIRSLQNFDGYTVKKPVAIIATGDKLIISDQLNNEIAIIQITYHPVIHYE